MGEEFTYLTTWLINVVGRNLTFARRLTRVEVVKIPQTPGSKQDSTPRFTLSKEIL